jgi:hypothetical protein
MRSAVASLALLLFCSSLPAADGQPLNPAEQSLLGTIRADTLKSHVSFLSSDLLDGRDTPSKGLDIAGEYIASQFRRFGLVPAPGNDGYFQVAPYLVIKQPMQGFNVKVDAPEGKSWGSIGPKAMVVSNAAAQGMNLDVIKVSIKDENTELPAKEAIHGKAVLLLMSFRNAGVLTKRDALLAMEPAVVLTTGFVLNPYTRLREAAAPKGPALPSIITSDSEFGTFAAELPEGPTAAKLSFNVPAPVEEPVNLRNVIGVLPGSDPALKNTCVLLSAHYDHVGLSPRSDGDRINNGANDDASGVATVLSLAEAFSSLKEKPRRTIVFMTYFGEEKGLLGSRYYASHPVYPLKGTIANLNFEHMGRTDDNEGSRVGKVTASGFDYTTIGDTLTEAGKQTGIEAWKHDKNSDAFFPRSDNQALADAGVPALTVAVSWIFPDYHRPGDHWDKIDYANMERVVRTMSIAVSRIANAAKPVTWIDTNPRVEKYLKAYQLLHANPN